MKQPSWSPGEGKVKAYQEEWPQSCVIPTKPPLEEAGIGTMGRLWWDLAGSSPRLAGPRSTSPTGTGNREGSTSSQQACPNPGIPTHRGRLDTHQGRRNMEDVRDTLDPQKSTVRFNCLQRTRILIVPGLRLLTSKDFAFSIYYFSRSGQWL